MASRPHPPGPVDGWAALERADWEAARDAFTARLADAPEDPAALDGLGRALWWLERPQDGVERRREAYALYRRLGRSREAANVATYLAAEHRIAGEPAAASGWLARAEGLLAGEGPCVEQGWLAVEQAKRAAGDPAEHDRHAQHAARLARELGDADLEAAALAQHGLALVDAGDIEGGMAVVDEAMAAATGEATDPLAIGDTCCTTLVACDRLADFERAAEWCRAVVDFTSRRGYTPLQPWCRTIYAGVLTATGDWERAEAELLEALRAYQAIDKGIRVFTIGRLAELRLRQGRLGEAERLLDGHEAHPLAVAASVLLAVEKGRHELACALADRRLAALADDPIAQAALLPVALEARLACGDLDGAADAARRTSGLGERLRRPNLEAIGRFGAGRVAAARGEAEHARALLDEAADSFRTLGMPLEEGRARLCLARVDAGELGLMHARGALDIFERLGARRDADAAAALLRERGAGSRSAPRIDGELTSREREVLDLLAEGLSNQAIGERLFISPKTAEHHVGRILAKLGLRSRTEAAAHVLRGEGS